MKRIWTVCLVALLASCSQQEVKLMSFNLRLYSPWSTEVDGENAWPNRCQAVADLILQEMPDALGVQEAMPEQMAYLDSALGGEYEHIGVGRDDGVSEGEHMCIFYRPEKLSLNSWKTLWLSETPDSVSRGWDAACNRTVTIAEFVTKQGNIPFVYMNTHLDHVGVEARKNSVLMLCNESQRYRYSCPVVIGGDMNSNLDDTIFQPLESYQLHSARDIAEVTDTSTTYNGFGKEKPTQIDHFFVKGVKKVKSFRTLNGDYGVPYVSDHYPIVVEMLITSRLI